MGNLAMRLLVVLLLSTCVLMEGCIVNLPGNRRHWSAEEANEQRNDQESSNMVGAEPFKVETAEIVRLLEKGRIAWISTSHAQTIYIQTVDGRTYKGTYVHSEAGKYSKDPRFADILNLVIHIKKKRPPWEVRKWIVGME
jgi:hypothetical protein